MEDESGQDEKIIAVPTAKIDASTAHINSIDDLNPLLRDRITHFFEHYKDLEKGKWVKLLGWEGPEKAKEFITAAVQNAQK